MGRRPSVCPSIVRPGGQPSRKKVRAVRPLTDDSCSFGGGECYSVVVSSSRWCFVRVSWVPALLDRGLGPPARTVAGLVFRACFAGVLLTPSVLLADS